MNKKTARIALVTGANKGIGFEICRQLGKQGIKVVMGCRDEVRGQQAAAQLAGEGLDVELAIVDVSEDKSVERVVNDTIDKHEKIDILVNNAGVLLDWKDNAASLKSQVLRQTMEVNFYGALRMIQAVLPFMKTSGFGRIVNLSSTMGSLSYNSGGGGSSAPAYRLSKTALNGLTAIFASEVAGSDIKINSACPGWVRTDMGGENATRSAEEGADTAVWLSNLPSDGPSGGFFKDREPMNW